MSRVVFAAALLHSWDRVLTGSDISVRQPDYVLALIVSLVVIVVFILVVQSALAVRISLAVSGSGIDILMRIEKKYL